MPTINGVAFTELVGSCKLQASQESGMVGTRMLDCAWADRQDATEAILGKIVVVNGIRNTIMPPDTFPGYDNLEVAELRMEGVGLTGEDADGGAAYDLARFTVTYRVLSFSQDAETGGDTNEGQFYETEEIDYEQTFITVPGGTYTVGTTKILDTTTIPIVTQIRRYTKRDLAALPSVSTWLGAVNDAAFPPGKAGAAEAGCLLFAGARSTRKVNAQGLVRYDLTYVLKERDYSWNQAIDPATGAWADISPAPFWVADFTAFATG